MTRISGRLNLSLYLLRISLIAHLELFVTAISPRSVWFFWHPSLFLIWRHPCSPLARAWLLKRGEMGEEYEDVSLSGLVERGVLCSPEAGPLLAIARVSSAPAPGMPGWTSSQPQPPLSWTTRKIATGTAQLGMVRGGGVIVCLQLKDMLDVRFSQGYTIHIWMKQYYVTQLVLVTYLTKNDSGLKKKYQKKNQTNINMGVDWKATFSLS